MGKEFLNKTLQESVSHDEKIDTINHIKIFFPPKDILKEVKRREEM